MHHLVLRASSTHLRRRLPAAARPAAAAARPAAPMAALLAGAVDLAPGAPPPADADPLQAACARTPVVSALAAAALPHAIATHSGSFHCDEALAIGMLKLLPEWRDAPVVRTRKTDVIDACKIVVDVGGAHDHARARYDHHQRAFNAEHEDVTVGEGFDTKLSSAGLVYKYYGRRIVDQVRQACGSPAEDEALARKIWAKVYAGFVEHVDGIDNGIEAFGGGDCQANYKVSTTLSSRVGRLNPSWNEPSGSAVQNAQFKKAMLLTQREFLVCVKGIYQSWLPARQIVQRAVEASLTAAAAANGAEQKSDGAAAAATATANKKARVEPSVDAQILVLDDYCPWIDHLFDLEAEKGLSGRFKYCLFPSHDGSTRVRAVPEAPGSFASRKALPAPWRGVRDDALSTQIGIDGAIFVHNSGFIGGNKTFEGAMAMARAGILFED